MKPLTRPEPPHTGGSRTRFGWARAWLSATLALFRAWRWGSVLGRVFIGALGLILLGAIGRSAFARNILSTEPPSPADAGAPAASMPPNATTGTTPVSAAAPLVAAADPVGPIASSVAATSGPPGSLPGAEAARGRATPEDPVYLNQATLADLHRLPGVGPKRAEAILALRARLGHFHQIEDLLKVKGIGRSSLRKLRPLVRLDAAPARGDPADASTQG